MSIENKIELLWEGAKTLQMEQPVHKLLKSYYINTCRKLAKGYLQVPKEKFAISQMCPHCSSFWNNIEYELKLTHNKIKNTSKVKRLIENLEQSNGTSCKVLNKSQRNRAKWLKKKVSNYVTIKCYQCQHSSLIKLEKSKFNLKAKSEEETCRIYSGNIAIKNQPKSNNISSFNKTQESKISPSIPLKSKKEHKTPRSKNKKKLENTAFKRVISDTRKQNSLLQLAALLQTQAKADLSNNVQKRLQSFLK